MNAFQSAPKNKKTLTLASLFVAILGSVMISSTQSTMLPVAALEIGGEKIYSLVTTLSGVLSVVCMPLYGYVIAKFPHLKRPIFSASMFVGAVVILSRVFAQSMWAIIIPGILYGFVSAGVYVVGYSMVRDLYDAKTAGLYLGFVGTFMSIATLLGPTVCGAVIDLGSWRYVNHLIWPFLLLASILCFCGVKVKKEDVQELAINSRFDLAGAICLAVFLGCFILVLSLGASFAPFGGLASNLMIVGAVVGLIGLVLMIRKKGQESILPIGVLKDRNTLALAGGNLFSNLSNMAAFFFIPTFALYVMQTTATQAGLTTTLMGVAGLFMGPIYGRMIGKAGTAKPVFLATTGLRIAIALAFVLLLNANTSLILLYVLMLIASFYSAALGVTFATAPQIQIDPSHRIQSNSVIQVCQNIGGSLGTAVYTLVIALFGIAQGMKVAFIISLVAAVLAFLCGLPLKKLETAEAKS